MLTLPEDWRLMSYGFVANALVARLPSAVRVKVTASFIEAALDLFLANRRHRNEFPLEFHEVAENRWQMRDAIYAYFETADDQALLTCEDLVKAHSFITIIVSSQYDMILNSALSHELGPRAPSVLSFPTFLSMRMLFSSGDADCCLRQSFIKLLQHYNQRITTRLDNESYLVELPPAEACHPCRLDIQIMI